MSDAAPDGAPTATYIHRLKQRDERAFNRLVLDYEKQVYRLVWRMLGNQQEAEDMTQEVFVQVWKSIDTFRGDSKLSTWLYRIALNLTKNRNKYLSRRLHKSHSPLDESEPDESLQGAQGRTSGEIRRPDWEAIGNETERVVAMSLHSLDEEYREILVLRDVENLSYEEVGAITNLPAGTVKSRLHRARSLLRAKVEELLGSPIP